MINQTFSLVCLINLMLYAHDKQLRSCRDGQLLNNTVPGQNDKYGIRLFCLFRHENPMCAYKNRGDSSEHPQQSFKEKN